MTTSFAPATSYAAGSEPYAVTTADVNGDGKLDLVVADFGGGGVDVLLGNGSGGFSAATSYAAGSGPDAVTTADVNGDGKLDLVVANPGMVGDVAVLLGNGSGGFSAATSYAAGSDPYSVTTADVNRDGKLDLVVADEFGGVDVLLGNGSGGFSATSYAAGSGPYAVTTADVNGDGKLDLLVADHGGNTVSVLLGNGSGSFSAATSYAAGLGPTSLTIADVNGDGKPDVVVTDEGTIGSGGVVSGGGVDVLLGDGLGSFSVATSYTTGSYASSVTTADVNGDGKLDLVVANQSIIDVLLGNGSGTFSAATVYAAGSTPQSVTAADVNRDGKPDLVVADYGGGVDVLLGVSATSVTVTSIAATSPGGTDLDAGKVVTFKVATSQPVTVSSPASTDLVLNVIGTGGKTETASYVGGSGSASLTFSYTVQPGDNTADLQVQSLALNGGNLAVPGSLAFSAATSYAAGSEPYAVTTADVNGDGKLDLVVADFGAGRVDVLLGNGAGGFSAAASYAAGTNPRSATTADVNGDGKLDLVVADFGGGVDVLLGNGSGSFSAATSYAAGSGPYSVTTADVNGDGKLDLVVADYGVNGAAGGVDVLLGNGLGSFSAATSYTAGSGPYSVTTADVNGDGKLDLVVADKQGGVDVLLGNGSGSFSAATSYAAGSNPNAVTTADVNGDGKLDLVVADASGGVDVLLGNGAGSFSAAISYAAGSLPSSVTTADVNGDGKPDLVVADQDGNTVSVLLGNGSGGFSAAILYAAGSSPSAVTTADVNGDGKLDLVVADLVGGVDVLLNNSTAPGTFVPASAGTASGANSHIQIDTVAPTIASETPSPTGQDLAAGRVVTFTIGTSEAVTAAGSALKLSNGTTATYAAASSTTTALVYSYTIAATDGNTADLQATALTGTITDGAGNTLNDASFTAIDSQDQVDTVAPTIATESPSPTGQDLAAGGVVTFTIGTSEAVTATGSALTLSNGTTATYAAASSTTTALTYSYTVASGDTNTADLQATALTGTLTDGAGNTLNDASFAPIDSQDQVDTVAPTIATESPSPTGQDLAAGRVVTFTIGTSEAVTATGSALKLSNGTTATYAAASSTPTSLVYSYTVASGDMNTADLQATALTGTITDGAGNTLNDASFTAIDTTDQVDTVAPTIASETPSPTGQDLAAGRVVTFTIGTSEAVTATGSALKLSNGTTATYAAASSTPTSLVYSYTVAATDENTADLQATALTGTITDGAGNTLNDASFTAIDSQDQVDTVAPTIATESPSPTGQDLAAGRVVTFTIGTSEAVTATGSALTLSNGTTATYAAASSTTTALTYSYTVASGDTNTADLQATALTGTLTDGAGNTLNDASFAPIDSQDQVDTVAPTIATESPSPTGQDLAAGRVVTFTIGTSEAVTATGSALKLSNGTTAAYASGDGTTGNLLSYSYTVAATDTNTADLQATALTGTITDGAGNTLNDASFAPIDSTDQVDTVAPTIATEAASPTGQDLGARKVVTFTIGTSEAVTATGSALTLSNGTTAGYASGDGTTGNLLSYSYTVAATDGNTADLQATALTGTITDGAGNTLNDASFAPIDTQDQVDTVAPTIASEMPSPTGQDLAAGQVVSFTIGTSEAVTAAGSALTLSNGTTATYAAASSTPTSLVYSYTVAATDTNTGDLQATKLNGTINDGAGNTLNDASFTAIDTQDQVDTVAPVVSSPTDTVAQNSAPTPIRIAAPTDNLTPAGNLAITAGTLPSDGTVTLADSTTAVTAGQTLSAAQLHGLEFTPTPGAFSQTSTFTYIVADRAGNASAGTATLVVGDPGSPTISGTHASATSAQVAVMPFKGVTLKDPSQASDTLAITLQTGGGALSGAGLVANADGSYTLAGSAASVAQELDALSFTPSAPPPGTAATTTFVLSDASSAGTAVTDANTSVTDTAAATPAPTIAQTAEGTNAMPAITGMGAAGAVINLTIDGTLQTPAQPITVGQNGSWSFTPAAPLPVGRNTAAATETKNGATSAVSNTDAFTVDPAAQITTTAPAAQAVTPDAVTIDPNVTFSRGTFTLTGTASSAAGVKSVEISAVLDDGSLANLGAATVNANGTFTFADTIGSNQQGFITATETDAAGGKASGGADYSLTGGLRLNGDTGRQTRYTDGGNAEGAVDLFKPDGAQTAKLFTPGQSFTSAFFDTFNNGGAPESTFVFDPGHGLDVVNLFRVGGTDHDTLSFTGSDFGATPASQLAAVLQNTHNAAGGAVITDPTSGDTVKLTGITKAQLAANRNDFAFHA